MKPLKLTIEGLHSFKEKQEVDFTQLCDTGLFGIFGPTGSGKSTILDAMTLALYGTVVRASKRTQGILNSQKDKLEVTFEFAIGISPNRKIYRVERSFRRNKDERDSVRAGICRLIDMSGMGPVSGEGGISAGGNLPGQRSISADGNIAALGNTAAQKNTTVQGNTEALENTPAQESRIPPAKIVAGGFILAEGTAEVNRKLEEIIGLTMDDFTRSVVLPQGEFSKFLKLTDSDRVRMLERIFALQEYGSKLNEKMKSERARLEKELLVVERAILEQGEVSAERVDKAKTDLEQAQLQKAEIIQETGKVRKELEECTTVWQLQKELQEIQEKEEVQLERKKEMEDQKAALLLAEEAETVRPYLTAFQKAEISLERGVREHEAAVKAYRAEEERNALLKERYQQAARECKEQQPVLIETRAHMQALLVLEQEILEKEKEREQLRQQYKTIAETIKSLDGKLKENLERKAQIEAQMNIAQEKIRELSVDTGRKERIIQGAALEKDYLRYVQEYETLQKQLDNEKKTKAELEKLLDGKTAGMGELARKIEELKTDKEKLEQIKPGDIGFFVRKNQEQSLLEKQIGSLLSLYAELGVEGEELARLAIDIREAEAEVTRYERLFDSCKKHIGQLEQQKEEYYREIEKAGDENLAYRLAARLKAGEPCPVCGSTSHPAPAQAYQNAGIHEECGSLEQTGCDGTDAAGSSGAVVDRLRAELVKLEEKILENRDQLEEYSQKLSMNRALHGQKQEQLQKLSSRMEDKREKCGELQAALPEAFRQLPSESLQPALEEERKQLEVLHKAIEKWDEDYRDVQERIRQLQEKLAREEADSKELEGRLKMIGTGQERLEGQLQNAKALLEEKGAWYTKEKEEMDLANFQQESDRILTAEKQVEGLRKQLEERMLQQKEAADAMEKSKEEREQLALQANEIETVGRKLADDIAKGIARIKEGAGDKKPGELLRETIDKLEALGKLEEITHSEYEQSQMVLGELAGKRSETQKQVEIFEKTVQGTRTELEERLEEKGFATIDAVKDALREEQERRLLKDALAAYEETCKKLRNDREMVLKKLEGRTLSYEQWECIRQKAEEMEYCKNEIFEQVTRLEGLMEDMVRRYEKVKEYEQERKKLAGRKSMADELWKMLQGEAFVAFIAEEHMRYILRDASKRLEMLTNNRYVLLMDENKDFIIQDNSNGGMGRPVSTLSGGEMFLVSLSLALALSSQIQLKGVNPLEFFFLDEGFGTLDPGLLEVVMDSLEKLRQGDLTVGVISHVPELRNRVSRRLIVTPADMSGEGSRVSIEKA